MTMILRMNVPFISWDVCFTDYCLLLLKRGKINIAFPHGVLHIFECLFSVKNMSPYLEKLNAYFIKCFSLEM